MLFILIVIGAFLILGTQWGSGTNRGKDLLFLGLFIVACIVLYFIWSGANVQFMVK